MYFWLPNSNCEGRKLHPLAHPKRVGYEELGACYTNVTHLEQVFQGEIQIFSSYKLVETNENPSQIPSYLSPGICKRQEPKQNESGCVGSEVPTEPLV